MIQNIHLLLYSSTGVSSSWAFGQTLGLGLTPLNPLILKSSSWDRNYCPSWVPTCRGKTVRLLSLHNYMTQPLIIKAFLISTCVLLVWFLRRTPSKGFDGCTLKGEPFLERCWIMIKPKQQKQQKPAPRSSKSGIG